MSKQNLLGNRAVVVGAGMGGLMAAGVLSRFFKEVVVLEKDDLPDEAAPRKSVPQGAHAHALLVQGRRNLEQIFPGFTSVLLDRGAICSRMGLEFRIRDAAGWFPEEDVGLVVIGMSRPLLEGTVRELLLDNSNVSIRGARVEGWESENGVVTGVYVKGSDGQEILTSDFTIDATGRGGKSASWLAATGSAPVEETILEIGTGYASALFRKPPGWNNSVDAIAITNQDPDTRGVFMFSIEDNRWVVSLTGRFDQQPTSDPDEYMAFAKSLCEPVVYEWMSQGERVTPISAYKAPVSRWRHYEKLTDFPERILPVGDAVAHVNPVFGQGMTLASAHVMGVWDILKQRAESNGSLDGISQPYFEQTHAFTEGVWNALKNLEYEFEGTRGERPADIEGRMAFSRALRKLAGEDLEVRNIMMGLANLIYPGTMLERPDINERIMEYIQAEMTAIS